MQMTTRDYLWLTLVVGLCFCLFGRWAWYSEQLRWAGLREVMLEGAVKRLRAEKGQPVKTLVLEINGDKVGFEAVKQ